MQFETPLVPARLVRRYMRFLADAELESGELVKAHCPNTGAMLGLKDPGLRIWLEPNEDPRKKLDWGWRLVELGGGHWAGIDTSVPNRVVKEALLAGMIPDLGPYETVLPEVPYGQGSRVDFRLGAGDRDIYLEVKNVHLRREEGWAEFPDSVTERGARHLRDLAEVVSQGHRAVMLYLVQRTDCTGFRLAGDLDPAYSRAFDLAREAGVEMLCFDTRISEMGVELGCRLPVTVDSRPGRGA